MKFNNVIRNIFVVFVLTTIISGVFAYSSEAVYNNSKEKESFIENILEIQNTEDLFVSENNLSLFLPDENISYNLNLVEVPKDIILTSYLPPINLYNKEIYSGQFKLSEDIKSIKLTFTDANLNVFSASQDIDIIKDLNAEQLKDYNFTYNSKPPYVDSDGNVFTNILVSFRDLNLSNFIDGNVRVTVELTTINDVLITKEFTIIKDIVPPYFPEAGQHIIYIDEDGKIIGAVGGGISSPVFLEPTLNIKNRIYRGNEDTLVIRGVFFDRSREPLAVSYGVVDLGDNNPYSKAINCTITNFTSASYNSKATFFQCPLNDLKEGYQKVKMFVKDEAHNSSSNEYIIEIRKRNIDISINDTDENYRVTKNLIYSESTLNKVSGSISFNSNEFPQKGGDQEPLLHSEDTPSDEFLNSKFKKAQAVLSTKDIINGYPEGEPTLHNTYNLEIEEDRTGNFTFDINLANRIVQPYVYNFIQLDKGNIPAGTYYLYIYLKDHYGNDKLEIRQIIIGDIASYEVELEKINSLNQESYPIILKINSSSLDYYSSLNYEITNSDSLTESAKEAITGTIDLEECNDECKIDVNVSTLNDGDINFKFEAINIFDIPDIKEEIVEKYTEIPEIETSNFPIINSYNDKNYTATIELKNSKDRTLSYILSNHIEEVPGLTIEDKSLTFENGLEDIDVSELYDGNITLTIKDDFGNQKILNKVIYKDTVLPEASPVSIKETNKIITPNGEEFPIEIKYNDENITIKGAVLDKRGETINIFSSLGAGGYSTSPKLCTLRPIEGGGFISNEEAVEYAKKGYTIKEIDGKKYLNIRVTHFSCELKLMYGKDYNLTLSLEDYAENKTNYNYAIEVRKRDYTVTFKTKTNLYINKEPNYLKTIKGKITRTEVTADSVTGDIPVQAGDLEVKKAFLATHNIFEGNTASGYQFNMYDIEIDNYGNFTIDLENIIDVPYQNNNLEYPLENRIYYLLIYLEDFYGNELKQVTEITVIKDYSDFIDPILTPTLTNEETDSEETETEEITDNPEDTTEIEEITIIDKISVTQKTKKTIHLNKNKVSEITKNLENIKEEAIDISGTQMQKPNTENIIDTKTEEAETEEITDTEDNDTTDNSEEIETEETETEDNETTETEETETEDTPEETNTSTDEIETPEDTTTDNTQETGETISNSETDNTSSENNPETDNSESTQTEDTNNQSDSEPTDSE